MHTLNYRIEEKTETDGSIALYLYDRHAHEYLGFVGYKPRHLNQAAESMLLMALDTAAKEAAEWGYDQGWHDAKADVRQSLGL